MQSKRAAARRDVLDAVSFDALVAEQQWFQVPDPVIDLTGITFVSPAALVQTAASCHALAGGRYRPSVVVPDLSVRSYLARSGFTKAVEDVAEITPQLRLVRNRYEALRGSNPLLIEVTRLEPTKLPDLLNRIVFVLSQKLRFGLRDAYSTAVAISEAAQNSLDHGGGSPGFLAMQVYGKGVRQFLQIGIADSGIGLQRSLASNPKHASIETDAAAIRAAVERGTSAYEDPTHGTGLYHLLDIASDRKGSVQIRSGAAKARYRGDKGRGWIIPVAHVPGVQIELSLGRMTRA